MLRAAMKGFYEKRKASAANDNFVRLIRIAKEDASLGCQLISVLKQTPNERQIVLTSILDTARESGAPKAFIEALLVLKDEKIADKALRILQKPIL